MLLGLSGAGEVDEDQDAVSLGDPDVLDCILFLEFFVEGLLDDLSDIAQLGIDLFKSFFQSHDSHVLEIRRKSLPPTLTLISLPSFQPIASTTRFGMVTIRVLPTRRSFIAEGILIAAQILLEGRHTIPGPRTPANHSTAEKRKRAAEWPFRPHPAT